MADKEYGRIAAPLSGPYRGKFVVYRYKGLRDVRDSVHDTRDAAARRLQEIASARGRV